MEQSVISVLDLDVKLHGVDSLESFSAMLKKFVGDAFAAGKKANEIQDAVKRIFNSWKGLQTALGKTPTVRLGDIIKPEEIEKIRTSLEKASQNVKLPLNPNTLKNLPYAAFNESFFGKALIGVRALNTAFSEVKGLYNFVSGIEKANQRLLLLHYSSGVGVSSLKDLGAAAEAFGGSAASIASAQERLALQIAKARRGEGFGFLQEAFWKYGFQVDLNWDATQMRNAAIEHLRTISDEADAIAFAKLIDPANAQQMLATRKMDPELYAKWQELQKYVEMQGALSSTDGQNRAEGAKRATQEFNMEVAKLKSAWSSIGQEILITILPQIKFLTENLRKFVDIINECPGLIRGIGYAIEGLGIAIMLARVKSLIGWLIKALGIAKSVQAATAATTAATTATTAATTATTAGAASLAGSALAAAFLAPLVGYSGYKIGNVIGEGIVNVMDAHEKKKESKINQIIEDDVVSIRRSLSDLKDRWIEGSMTSEDIQKAFDTKVSGLSRSQREDIKKSLESFEAFCERVKEVQKRMGKLAGVADSQLNSIDPSRMKVVSDAYSSLINNNSVDNSRTQNQINISINGAQDPDVIKDKVVEASHVILGTNLNSSGEK